MGMLGQKLSEDELATAWLDLKDRGDLEARNRLVVHYTSLVQAVASKVATTLPKMVDRDDLISYGIFGLFDAIEKFDPSKQVKFETYAVTRVRGAIMDEIRVQDWAPRTLRSRARDLERVESRLHAELGRPATEAEVATELGVKPQDLWALRSQTHSSMVVAYEPQETTDESAPYHHLPVDHSQSPEQYVAVDEVKALMAGAIDSLPQRSKTILVLYYLHDMTLAEIGEILGVTETRVCQLQGKLLQALKLNLGGVVAA